MNFINAIEVPLKIWHAFALSTFRIQSIPSTRLTNFRIIFVVIACLLYLYFIYALLSTMVVDRKSFGKLLFRMFQQFSQLMSPITNFIIFLESIVKSNDQKRFLDDMLAIDAQFEQCLGINVKYPSQKRRHLHRLIRWMLINLIVELAYPIYGLVIGANWIPIFASLLFVNVPSVIISLRYYQYTTFVDMINWRYALINEYINDFYAIDISRLPFDPARPSTVIAIDMHLQRLTDIRRICLELYTASQRVNELFVVSLALCILLRFCGFFTKIYDAFKMMYLLDMPLYGFMASISVIIHANDLTSMAVVCEQTTNEVNY